MQDKQCNIYAIFSMYAIESKKSKHKICYITVILIFTNIKAYKLLEIKRFIEIKIYNTGQFKYVADFLYDDIAKELKKFSSNHKCIVHNKIKPHNKTKQSL